MKIARTLAATLIGAAVWGASPVLAQAPAGAVMLCLR